MSEDRVPNPPSPTPPANLPYAAPLRIDYSPHIAAAAIFCAILFLPVAYRATVHWRAYSLTAFLLCALPVATIALAHVSLRISPPPPRRTRVLVRVPLLAGWLQLLLVLGAAMLPELDGPGLTKTRGRIQCSIHLRQIGYALLLYANANHNQYPPTLDVLLTDPYADLPWDAFVCPATADIPATGPTTRAAATNFRSNPRHCSYVYLPPAVPIRRLHADHVIAHEHPANHAGEGMNVLFADGHVEWLQKSAANHLLSELQSGHNPPRPPPTQPRP